MIYLSNESLKVINFIKILKVESDEIVVKMKNKTVYILGNNLCISSFEKEEFEIIGNINEIKINKD